MRKMKGLIVSACLLGIPCRYDGASKHYHSEKTISELRERYHIVPVCPEILGGLPTPRTGSERVGLSVLMKDGRDVTENYKKGAEATLTLARLLGCDRALLKERSPSCGRGAIYDGTFTETLTAGDGVCAELLLKNGIEVYGESEAEKLL